VMQGLAGFMKASAEPRPARSSIPTVGPRHRVRSPTLRGRQVAGLASRENSFLAASDSDSQAKTDHGQATSSADKSQPTGRTAEPGTRGAGSHAPGGVG
jgi:hypothetical protein